MSQKSIGLALEKAEQMQNIAIEIADLISKYRDVFDEVPPEFAIGYATGAMAIEDVISKDVASFDELIAYARGYVNASLFIAENNAASLEVIIRLLELALEEAV